VVVEGGGRRLGIDVDIGEGSDVRLWPAGFVCGGVVMVVAVTKLPKFENELSAARDIPQPYRLASIHTYTF
jgi:hypothetical protein